MSILLDNSTQELLSKYNIRNMYDLENKRFQHTQLLRLYLAITEYAENKLSNLAG